MADNPREDKTPVGKLTSLFEAFTLPLFDLERPKTSPVKSGNASPIYDTPLIRRTSESVYVAPPAPPLQPKTFTTNYRPFPESKSSQFQIKKNWVEITGMVTKSSSLQFVAKKNLREISGVVTKNPSAEKATQDQKSMSVVKQTKKLRRILSVDSQKSIYKLSRKSLWIYRSMNPATIQNRMGLGTPTVSLTTPPELLEKNYIFEKEIACGGFSIVYQASYAHDRSIRLACKHLRHNDLPPNSPLHAFAKEEVKIMSIVSHANIIELVDVISVGKNYFILMKFAVNGNVQSKSIVKQFAQSNRFQSLQDYLYETAKSPLWEDTTKEWMGCIFNALAYLHRSSIVHRDLKLENFFLDARNNVILGDFGFAVRTRELGASSLLAIHCGTAEYMAPETHMAAKYSNAYYDPYPADIYSMGVCMFEMLNYAKPFKLNTFGSGYGSLVSMQNNKDYLLRHDLYFTDECKDLINQLLEPRPSLRPKADQVLTHIWFRVRLR